ncbi:peptidoglycan-binding protein, partial [Alcanivoracaceae bacterium MT1]
TITLFIDKHALNVEFAEEFLNRERKKNLEQQVHLYIKNKLPHLKINIAKVMIGSVIFSIIPLYSEVSAEDNQSPSQLEDGNFFIYSVVQGDALSVIAKKFNVTVEEIQQLNNLTGDLIYVGQDLKIPIASVLEENTDMVASDEMLEETLNNEEIDSSSNSSREVQQLEETEEVPTEISPSEISLQNGDRHENVIELKRQLAIVGFIVPGNNTNYFGPQTEQQVRAFQGAYGLPITGIADHTTVNWLQEIVVGPLKNGMYRDDVVKLKNNLAIAGFPVPGNTTIFFGSNTEAKVMDFQKAFGLPITGIADQRTVDKLEKVATGPLISNSCNW